MEKKSTYHLIYTDLASEYYGDIKHMEFNTLEEVKDFLKRYEHYYIEEYIFCGHEVE